MTLTGRVTRLVARGKPLVPEKAWPMLLALRSARGDKPLIGLPAFTTVVVLAAHPDDESLGCAGTIALLTARNTQVTVAYATDGEATIGADLPRDEIGRRRQDEARAACNAIGVTDVRFWGLPDGAVANHRTALAERIEKLQRELSPDAIFLPWFLDGHPDHEAIGAAMAHTAPTAELWGYETWTPLPANRLVDITPALDRKQKAIASHATAMLAFDIEASLGLNRWRSIHGLMGRGYAEAFLAAPAAEWLALRRKAT